MTHQASGNTSRGLRGLNKMLGVDPQAGLAIAEPGVTMENLVKETLAHGCLPKVLPEFKEITVGGAIMGAGLESSSFRYGQVNDICVKYELLLGNGEKVEVSPSRNAELFHAVSGSYGSFASLSLAEIAVVPVEPWVYLKGQCYSTINEWLAAADQAATRNEVEYIDGMQLVDGRFCLMIGCGVSSPEGPTWSLRKSWDKWFCQRVIESCENAEAFEVYLPIYDYVFRYDRGAFWMGQFATRWRALWRYLMEWRLEAPQIAGELHRTFKAAPPTVTPSLAVRAFLGWKLSSSRLYQVLHALPGNSFARTFLVQDYYIPKPGVAEFVNHVNEHIQIRPLWLCPIRHASSEQFLSPHFGSENDFVNVGVYGVPKDEGDVLGVTKDLEALTAKLGGRKMLYGCNRYTQAEFWDIYPKERYDSLRQQCSAGGTFRDLYERVCPSS